MPIISTQGSHESSGISSCGADVRPPVSLGMLDLDFLENLDGLSRGSRSRLGSKRSHKLNESAYSTRQKITNGNNEPHS
jgi:hypothetical protein